MQCLRTRIILSLTHQAQHNGLQSVHASLSPRIRHKHASTCPVEICKCKHQPNNIKLIKMIGIFRSHPDLPRDASHGHDPRPPTTSPPNFGVTRRPSMLMPALYVAEFWPHAQFIKHKCHNGHIYTVRNMYEM